MSIPLSSKSLEQNATPSFTARSSQRSNGRVWICIPISPSRYILYIYICIYYPLSLSPSRIRLSLLFLPSSCSTPLTPHPHTHTHTNFSLSLSLSPSLEPDEDEAKQFLENEANRIRADPIINGIWSPRKVSGTWRPKLRCGASTTLNNHFVVFSGIDSSEASNTLATFPHLGANRSQVWYRRQVPLAAAEPTPRSNSGAASVDGMLSLSLSFCFV